MSTLACLLLLHLAQPAPESGTHLVDALEIRIDVEIGILVGGDEERALGEAHVLGRHARDACPALLDRRHARLASGRFTSRFWGFMRRVASGVIASPR